MFCKIFGDPVRVEEKLTISSSLTIQVKCSFVLTQKNQKVKTGEKQLKLVAPQLKENNSSRLNRDSNRFSFLTLLCNSFFKLFFAGLFFIIFIEIGYKQVLMLLLFISFLFRLLYVIIVFRECKSK